jgi:ATP-dependent DNA helicase RecQ
LPREARARGRSRPAPSSKREPVDASILDADGRALFDRLKAHRAGVAKDRGIPAYVIAHDRTLVAIAAARPRSTNELLAVHGMGPARAEQYGEGFLRVITGEPN